MSGVAGEDHHVWSDHGVGVEIEQTANNQNHERSNNLQTNNLNERKMSWAKLRHVDSLHMEAGRVSQPTSHGSNVSWQRTLSLAFQSIGVIYGDIGTSPLYVFSSTFTDGFAPKEDLLGVLSLIIYTIILIPVFKYVFIVLRANDNGDGGTFALYSLICRYTKVSLIPNDQPEDREVSNYNLNQASNQSRRAQSIRKKLETSKNAQIILFLVTILGTSMVIGDGILTPCISVLSAVSGIKSLSTDAVMWISIVILIFLFCVQRFGTDKVGYTFAPIVCIWFLFISGIGLYNLFKYDITVLRAFNPKYIIDYFKRNGKKGWVSLGGVVLCITGTEAMFADLGHFNIRAVQISFSGIVLPALLTAYSGQAAYVVKFPENVGNTFYASIPGPLYWPTFLVAVAAAIIASQAMISGAFAIISQSLNLGCFPRVKVVHTSAKYEGQVYIPEVNYILMVACIIVTLTFKTTQKIGNAYGIAVVAVMIITTCLVTLIMLVIWKTNIWLIIAFFVVFISIESLYFSSVIYKFVQGGFFPLAFAAVLMMIMGTWHYVHKKRYEFELENKVSNERIRELVQNPNVRRVPGIGLLYSELVQGVPPIFPHFIDNIPSIHSVLVFVSIKSLPISKVAIEERYVFRQVEPKDYRMYRCVVRYGYKDSIEQPNEFERQIVEHLKDFIRNEYYMRDEGLGAPSIEDNVGQPKTQHKASNNIVHVEETLDGTTNHINLISSNNGIVSPLIRSMEEEMEFVQRAYNNGVFYLLGEAEVRANENSNLFKKFVVNYVYGFLRKNSRHGEKVLLIPKTRLLRVGMNYEI